jgi:hypothetical protein
MRERFLGWGAELSDADFACALAAAGTEIQSRLRPGSGLLVWRLGERLQRLDAGALARAWRAFLASAGLGTVGIEIDPRSLMGLRVDPRWVAAQLSRPEVGAAFIRIRATSRSREKDPVEGTSGDIMPPRDPPTLEPGRDEGTKGTKSYSVGDDLETVRVGGTDRSPRGRGKKVTPAPDSPRFLQAQLQDRTNPNRPVRVEGTLRPATSYQAAVRIGLPDREWASLDTPFPSLPPQPEGHWLTVIFWEPQVSPEPQVKPLWLPPKGSSEPVSFSFETPADGADAIAARITVLHANRVLQTGLLRARIGRRGRWTFELDAVPRAHLEGLSDRSRFDVALVLNHDAEGTPRLTAAADDQAVVVSLSENAVEGLTDLLGHQISKIAAAPERYEALHGEGTQELLRVLAQKGGALHKTLCKHTFLARLSQPDAAGRQPRIHLTSAKADSFLPIELLYRFEPPEDTAQLCEHALEALAKGSCLAECPSDKEQTVCPLGFWGMCRVIERHAHRPEHNELPGAFQLRPEPLRERDRLDVSGSALLAASDLASTHETGAVQSLYGRLRKRGPAALVSTWQEWAAHVASDRPQLLVLLPHHARQDGFEVLEIGAGDPLKSSLVKKKHVLAAKPPVVLLMGCETNLARIAFDNFATLFLDEGAAVVVSTIATILGRHASPATALLVDLLDQLADGKHTLGDVMLRLRQTLVAKSTPMALGLTAYGDADWVLTKEG